ncbi:hypothetical protein LTR41_012032, partial [Exophiala xenobiotica]
MAGGLTKVQQRLRLAIKIEAQGFLNMAPCPQCVSSNSICIVREGNARCSVCTRKNVKCGSTFSDAEYDSVEAQKRELKARRRAIQAQLASLAQQLPSIEQQLDRLDDKQKKMVDRESDVLGELENFSAGDSVAMMSNTSAFDGAVDWDKILGNGDQGVQG